MNSVPSRTRLEMYIRAKTVEAIFETNRKVNRALRAGALAVNCDLEIQDMPGYFPFTQDKNLTELVKKHILDYMKQEKIAQGTHGFASGDMGDISMMWPTVEIGIAGFPVRSMELILRLRMRSRHTVFRHIILRTR